MATADKLLELMFSWIEQRESCAEQLKKMATELESLRENCNVSECVGSTVSVVGSLSLIGAGVATLLTGGAAAPLLGLAGSVCSGTGILVSLGTKIKEYFKNSSTMTKAQTIEEKSKIIKKEIQEYFEKLREEIKKVNPYADPGELDADVIAEFMGAIARRSGLKKIELSQYISIDDLVNVILKIFTVFDLISFLVSSGIVGQLAGHFSKCIQPVTLILGIQVVKRVGKQQGKQCANHLTKQLGPELGKELGKRLGKQYSKTLYTTGVKTALKGGAKVAGGAVGLVFDLPEAISNWKDMIKKNNVTEASKSLKDTANAILDDCQKLRNQFNDIKKRLEQLAAVKLCIDNRNRSDEEKKKLIEFAIEQCEDEDVKQWLRENSESEVFSELVDMFHFIEQALDKGKEKTDRKEIDIILVAHGAIEEPLIQARYLLALPTISDVLLYSPWNCIIDADAAYVIATGSIEPQHRVFKCAVAGCEAPVELHQPTNLPDRWNSMKEAERSMIPNIILGPLEKDDSAWNYFEKIQRHHGEPGRNRIVIPFKGKFRPKLRVPFSVISLALSLVLLFTPYEATIHLAACLGKISATRLDEDRLKKQYALTINKTVMTTSEELLVDRNTEMYRAFKSVFG